MATICFVIQQLPSATIGKAGSPSGTLTVVSQLLKHWGTNDKLLVLCNHNYGNLAILEALQREIGFDLHKLATPTYQSRAADINTNSRSRISKMLLGFATRLSAPFLSVRALLALRRFYIQERIDVIYSHSGGYPFADLNLLSVVAGKLTGLKKNFLVIHNVPNPVFLRRLPFSFIQDRFIGICATKILSVSQACAEDIARLRFIDKPIGFVHNGIPLTPPNSSPLTTPPSWAKSEVPSLLFLGSLQPRKGVHILLEALSNVNERCSLVLYGTGNPDYVAKLKTLVEEKNLSDRVLFCGFDQNASQYLKYATALVLPSIAYESFGMVILEAMDYSKPVICSDFGGMKEVVEDGKTGIVVPAGDALALSRAISRLLKDPAMAEEMGTRGYLRLRENFDISKSVNEYHDLVTAET